MGDRRALEVVGDAQITANDLALAGVAPFTDVDRLTVFADNVVPHVLRSDGILVYAPELAAVVDAGIELAVGGEMEREIRACALHACELLARRLLLRRELAPCAMSLVVPVAPEATRARRPAPPR